MDTYISTINDTFIKNIKSKAYKDIEKILFKNEGSLHGGYVRDEIRGVLPEDMDVSFKNTTHKDNFIKTIKSKKEFNEILIKKLDKRGKYNFNSNIHSIETLDIKIIFGYIPFIYDGSEVCISIDIVTIIPNLTIEPPFNNLDMLCNAFIKTKDGIRLSNSTGKKILDELDNTNRIIVSAEIIKLIRKSETYLCFGIPSSSYDQDQEPDTSNSLDSSFSSNYQYEENILNIVALRRFLKLKDRFHFLNLPFGTKLYDGKKCEIAYCSKEDYTPKTILAYTSYPSIKKGNKKSSNKRATYCFDCMIGHLKAQHDIMLNKDPDNEFSLRCPLRNPINFSTCEESFEKFIKEILQSKNCINN